MTREELLALKEACDREVERTQERFEHWQGWWSAAVRAHHLSLMTMGAWALSDCLHLGELSLQTGLAALSCQSVIVFVRMALSMQASLCTKHVLRVTKCLREALDQYEADRQTIVGSPDDPGRSGGAQSSRVR